VLLSVRPQFLGGGGPSIGKAHDVFDFGRDWSLLARFETLFGDHSHSIRLSTP
jgi:hypothetical protein